MAGKEGNRPSSRRDRLIQERTHDPYEARHKPSDPAVCPQCNAVYQKGSWGWSPPPAGAEEHICQACHRINDKYPAGEITMSGTFLAEHKSEIMHLIQNQEEAEKSKNPLHRIMAIEEEADAVVVTTTDIQLPRQMAEAVHRAYKGEMNFNYDKEGHFIRANWSRGA